MENIIKKCSLKEHKDIDAIYFCQECRIYICNKCDSFHSNWYKDHHKYNLDKNSQEFFTGICQENNHSNKLKYFCKTHNKLCCAECITKIKDSENGQHNNCDICLMKEIELIKKNKLKQNLEYLEKLSLCIKETINNLKLNFEKICENKEKLKLDIQKLFTKLRNILNDREDSLLQEIENYFNDNFFSEEIIREGEKLPNKIKLSFQKGKNLENNWEAQPLEFSINDCLIIEKNIDESNKIKENLKKCNSNFKRELIIQNGDEINVFSKLINNFGKLKLEYDYFNSNIEFNQELVKSWLNNRDFDSELLFRKTRDGSTSKDFHNNCDNKGTTITFIETTKGYKFGGYTESEWDTSGDYKNNGITFIFSLNDGKKYLSKDNKGLICGRTNYGPFFGNNYPEIVFYNSLDRGRTWDQNSENLFLSGRKLTNGEEFWDTKEIEVFKINYK